MAKKRVAVVGDITIDFDRMELRRLGQIISATSLEFRLLKLFVDHPGRVFSRQELIGAAWPNRKRANQRIVDNSILHLRQKLEGDLAYPVLFETVFGVGYKFVPNSASRVVLTPACGKS